MACTVEPLDPATTKDIRRVLARLHNKIQSLDQYEACGIDCQDFRASLQYLITHLETINSTFGCKE